MRKKTKILIIFALFFCFFLLLWYGIDRIKVSERAKNLLLEEINQRLNGYCDINSLKVRFNKVLLTEIEIYPENRNFSIYIDEIGLRYNIINLFKNNFSLNSLPEELTIIHPFMSITIPQSDNKIQDKKSDKDISYFLEMFKKISKDIDFLKKINISDGEAQVNNFRDEQLKIASDINGWVDLSRKDFMEFKFDGCAFTANEKNFRLTGKKFVNEDKYIGRLRLKNYKLDERNPVLVNRYFQFSSGIINSDLYFEFDSNTKKLQDIVINGNFMLQDGKLMVLNEKIRCNDIFLKGNVKNNNFVIDEFRQMYNGSEVNCSGSIRNIFNPKLNVKVTANGLNIDKFQSDILPDLKEQYAGKLFLNLEINGDIRSPEFTGGFVIDDFSINRKNIGDIKTKISYNENDLKVRDFVLENRLGTVNIYGDLGLKENIKVDIFVNAKQDFGWLTEKSSLLKFKSNESILEAGFSGDLNDLKGMFKIIFNNVDSTAISGNVNIKDKRLEFIGRSLSQGLEFSGSLDLKNKNWMLTSLTNPFGVINEIVYIPFFSEIEKNIEIEFKAEKSENNYTFWGRGYKKGEAKDENIAVDLNGFSKREDGKRFIYSQVLYYPNPKEQFVFNLDVVKEKDKFIFNRFDIPGIFNLDGNISQSYDVDAELVIKTGVSVLEKFFQRNFTSLRNGEINGLIKFKGALSHPDISGKIEMINADLGGISGFDGLIDFQSEEGNIFVINKVIVNDKNKDLIAGWGKIDLKEDNIYFTMKGDSLDCEMILNTINYRKGLISGFVNTNLELIGKLPYPKFFGSINLKNGKIYGHSFSNLYVSLGNPKKINGAGQKSDDYYNSSLAIRKFSVERGNKFVLTGEGYLPFNRSDEVDLLVEGKGDILSLLPEFEEFFLEGGGNGSFNVRIVGNFDNLTAGSGNMKISDGYLKFSSVFKELRDIQLDASLSSGERFIKINNLTALADDREVRISNAPSVTLKNDEGNEIDLYPMVLKDDGLNWGTLIIENDKRGLRLNIPALMEKGEIGTIYLSGKNPEEKFYLAGPRENPVLRGRIDVNKMDFTYPFIIERGGSGEKGIVERFIEKIQWDMAVYSSGDVRYFRAESSGFSTITDKIYLNISIDDVEDGIEFMGSISDDSFKINGKVVSTRGTIEFWDLIFRVERFEVAFDQLSEFPIISGRARTTMRDSTDFPRDIYLVPYYKSDGSIDNSLSNSFENLRFRFEINEPSGENPALEVSQEEILKMLGYSVFDIKEKAPMVVGLRAQNVFLRPIVRPIERKIRNFFSLDELTLRPSFAKNITQYFLESSLNISPSKRLGEKIFYRPSLLFQSSSLVLGKYILDDFYFSYEGQLVTGFVKNEKEKLGISHLFGLEYRIAPGIMLEMQYDYQFDRYQDKKDKRLWIRQYFRLSD